MTEESDNLQEPIKGSLEFKKRYSDLKLLGEGGGGKVFRAQDNKLIKQVAIKVLHGNVDARDIVRFQQEAKVLSKLDNQFIVKLFDFEHSDEDEFFLVMEYVEGKMLDDILKESGPFPIEDAVKAAMQICTALQHAHAQGVIHRDLKPSNVMIDANKNVRILDFGIAKLMNRTEQSGTLTRKGAAIGSPMYMSPEQVRADETDERTDIYGLGLLLYMMLAGKPPFDSEHMIVSFQQRLSDEPPPHLRLYAGETETAHALNDIVRKALRSDPDERYQSMTEFRSALGEFLTENEVRQITAHGVSAPVPKSAAIGILVVVVIIVGAVISLVYYGVSFDSGKQLPGEQKKTVKKVKNPFVKGFHENFDDKKMSDFWFADSDLTDAGLRILDPENLKKEGKECPHLSLYLNKKITSEGIKYVTTLPLTALDLSETNVTDDDLKEVAKMKKLDWLKISNTKTTDRGVANLGPLKNTLTKLDLDTCHGVTDVGMRFIVNNFKGLEWLHIGDTSVTPKAVHQVTHLPKLERLWVSSLKLKDEDIAAFSKMPLILLDITNNHALTDRIFTILKDMPLRTVEAIYCEKLSPQAVAKWQEDHPLCAPLRVNNPTDIGEVGTDLISAPETINEAAPGSSESTEPGAF
jgi:predicted Ser/Thr protein kinase